MKVNVVKHFYYDNLRYNLILKLSNLIIFQAKNILSYFIIYDSLTEEKLHKAVNSTCFLFYQHF